MKSIKLLLLLFFVILSSCIQEDIVDDAVPEEIRIISNVNSLKLGDIVKFEAAYFNNVGQKENKTIVWETSNPNVLSVDNTTTNITAKAEGTATITAKTTSIDGEDLIDHQTITVVANEVIITPVETVKKGTFVTTSSYDAAGDFEMITTTTGIQINLASNYVGDESLPGFALYLTNNPNSLTNALEIDAYDDADGAHYKGIFTYNIEGVGINDYQYLVQWCRPFSILVGQATITDK